MEVFFGQNRYMGELQNGLPNGSGSMYFHDNSIYKGNWQNGIRSGYGTMTWPSGLEYEGCWENDKFNGEGTLYYEDGRVYKGQFVDWLQHGNGILWQVDGQRFEGKFENGKITEDGRYYDANGNLLTIDDIKRKERSARVWNRSKNLIWALGLFALAPVGVLLLLLLFEDDGPSHVRGSIFIFPIMCVISGIKFLSAFFRQK